MLIKWQSCWTRWDGTQKETPSHTIFQVSILASQAPTNPDLDVEEEAAERQSLAAQTNGTTPADLQISCKLRYFTFWTNYQIWRNPIRWKEKKKIQYDFSSFSNQHGWSKEEVGQAPPSQEIWASHWCTHTEVIGDLQGAKKEKLNFALNPVPTKFLTLCLFFSACGWVLEHASQNRCWSERRLGEVRT